MQPLIVVTLIMLGSCFSIMVSLTAVVIIVLVLGDEYPRLQHEFEALLASLAIFVGMTIISAASFYALLKNHVFRYWGQVVLWAGVAVTGWHYWP